MSKTIANSHIQQTSSASSNYLKIISIIVIIIKGVVEEVRKNVEEINVTMEAVTEAKITIIETNSLKIIKLLQMSSGACLQVCS